LSFLFIENLELEFYSHSGYPNIFKTTYLYGSYSPISGDSFVWKINGVSTKIFEAYLKAFSLYKSKEYKIVVIDNARFHSTKHVKVPPKIYLLETPPYNPELNPCEQIWQYLKNRLKNRRLNTIEDLTQWLHNMVKDMKKETIKSITGNHHYLKEFMKTFNI